MIIWNFPMGVPMGSPFWKEVQSEAKFGRKFMEVQGPTMLHASGQASGTVAPVAPSQGVSCRAIRPKLDVTRGQTTPKKGCFTHFYWDFTMKTCRWVAWILWPRNGFVQKLSSGKDHPCREKEPFGCAERWLVDPGFSHVWHASMDIITMCEWIKLHGNPEAMPLMGSTKQTFEAMRLGFSNIPCLSVVPVVQILHVMCIHIYIPYTRCMAVHALFSDHTGHVTIWDGSWPIDVDISS